MKQISLLIGSGFSIPCGIPGVGKIIEVLSNLDSFNFSGLSKDRLKALGDVYDEYKKANEKNAENIINYEVLYDFVVLKKWKFLNSPIKDYFINLSHCNLFKENNSMIEHLNGLREDENKYFELCEIEKGIQKLISAILSKEGEFNHHYFPNTRKKGKEIHQYEKFLTLMDYCRVYNHINLHTLNHDLLLDFLLKSHATISPDIDDGFDADSSPFYYDENVLAGTKRFIPSYNGSYKKQFRLFKLHGCLSQFVLREKDSTEHRIQLFPNLTSADYIKSKDNSTSKKLEPIPFFMTGKYLKPNYLNVEGSIQKDLFDFFRDNLSQSHAIIIIGYGFGDLHVNDYLRPIFRDKEILKIVIDYSSEPIISNLPIFEKIKNAFGVDINENGDNANNIHFDMGGAIGFSLENIISLLKN